MFNKGLLLIISGPSGAGKGTVVNKLIEEGNFALSISATTRKPREGEQDKVHYFFKSVEEFKKMIANDELLEYAIFCDNYYGTPKSYVDEQRALGKNIILEIEVQGALQVKENNPDAVLVFMAPPSIEELNNRLIGRGTETAEVIVKRISRAIEEIELIDKYDYVVINDVVENAVNSINTIVNAEYMKADRNLELKNFLKGDEGLC